MSRTVLILQHADGEDAGTLASALEAAGHSVQVVHAYRDEPIPSESLAAGLAVLGGPMSVNDTAAHPWLEAERALIRRMIDAGKPVLGICLGAEQVAAALGAKVSTAPRLEIGWRLVELAEAAASDVLFEGCPKRFEPLHWHGDVFDLPEDAVPLASSAQTPLQAFSFRGLAWGLLFHLEVTPEIARAMVRSFPDELSAAGLTPSDVLGDLQARTEALHPVSARVFERWSRAVAG